MSKYRVQFDDGTVGVYTQAEIDAFTNLRNATGSPVFDVLGEVSDTTDTGAVDTSTAKPTVSNVKVASVTSPVSIGQSCKVKVAFDYQGAASSQVVRVAIGNKGAFGFDEVLYTEVGVSISAASSKQSRSFTISIPLTEKLSPGIYAVYGKIAGVSSPAVLDAVTVKAAESASSSGYTTIAEGNNETDMQRYADSLKALPIGSRIKFTVTFSAASVVLNSINQIGGAAALAESKIVPTLQQGGITVHYPVSDYVSGNTVTIYGTVTKQFTTNYPGLQLVEGGVPLKWIIVGIAAGLTALGVAATLITYFQFQATKVASLSAQAQVEAKTELAADLIEKGYTPEQVAAVLGETEADIPDTSLVGSVGGGMNPLLIGGLAIGALLLFSGKK